ncbi:hypothetical protein [Proteiniclasticum sp.]|uniref:hypothetical protein n=1 Tax=Proteiniclasticum sp. TaxID=2053595 RepID=UPI002898B674|nr:hypothetical protein [Proteiniclasticum sp.]
MFKKVLITILVILLGLSNIFLYTTRDKMDYDIIIGTPGTEGTDLSVPISDKNEASMLIFSLMNSESIAQPEITEDKPDSIIWINDSKEGFSYTTVSLWIDGSGIILGTNVDTDYPLYKELSSGRAADMIQIIRKYQTKS